MRPPPQSRPALSRPALPRRVVGLALALALGSPSCAVDGLLLTELARKGHPRLPDPAPQRILGEAPAAAGGQVLVLTGDGKALAGVSGPVAANGGFALQVDGAVALVEAVVQARKGRRQLLAVVPTLPAQAAVRDPERSFQLADLSPGAQALDTTSTTLALLVAGKLRRNGQPLTSAAPLAMIETLQAVHQQLLAGDPALVAFGAMVARIEAAADVDAQGDATLPYDLAGKESLLRKEFLLAQAVDYDGDGVADLTTTAFDQALVAATDGFQFKACYEKDRIRVVLQVRLSTTAKNGNCEAVNPFLWADDKLGAAMFVTGGVHEDTPVCSATRTSQCLTADQVDAVNQQLGNWVPNKVAMRDDGTGGDATAGDGVWTAVFDLPYWVPAQAPDGAGVRLAYKFTYGKQGQGWTGSEEFPGNQRILELADENGDALVVRFDHFADETGNKDKANQLAPAAGGCGENTWPGQGQPGCASDARERPVDLDGDCAIDGYPPAGPIAPLTVPCPEQ